MMNTVINQRLYSTSYRICKVKGTIKGSVCVCVCVCVSRQHGERGGGERQREEEGEKGREGWWELVISAKHNICQECMRDETSTYSGKHSATKHDR